MINTATLFVSQISNAVTYVGYSITYSIGWIVKSISFIMTNFISPITYSINWLFSSQYSPITWAPSAMQIVFAWLGGYSVTVYGATYDFTTLANIKWAGFQGGMVIIVLIGIMYLFMIPFLCITRMSLAPLIAPILIVWKIAETFIRIAEFFIRIIETILRIIGLIKPI